MLMGNKYFWNMFCLGGYIVQYLLGGEGFPSNVHCEIGTRLR